MILPFLIFLLAAFTGSSNPVFIRFATVEVPPIIFGAVRFLVATLLIFSIFRKEIKKIPLADLYKTFPYVINMVLYVIGIQYTSLTMSGILYTFAPVLTAPLGYIFLKEKISKLQVLGFITAFIGVVILIHGSIETSDLFSLGTPLGNVLLLFAVFVWGFYPVGARSLSKSYNTPSILFYTFGLTGLTSLFLSPVEWFVRPLVISNISYVTVIGIFGSAAIGTVIFYFCYQWFIKHTSAFTGSLILYGSFMASTFYGAVFFKEHLTGRLLIGAFFIIAGVFLATTYTQLKKRT